MGLGTSLFLIAVGAVLRFAVTVSTHGIDLQTVGVILMVVGAVGFVISLFWMAMAADRRGTPIGPRGDVPTTTVRETDPRYR
jgi:uncharacterized membrane protein